VRLWVLLAVTVGACGTRAADRPSVELGTGDQAFIVLHDGDPVPIIHGLQGGYHVWGAVRASDLAPMGVHLQFTLARLDDAVPVTTRTDVADLVDGEHLGTAVFVPDPDGVRGQPCTFDLTAIDTHGTMVHSQRTIVPQ